MVLILAVAFLLVFVEATFGGFRAQLAGGASRICCPSLMIYTGLSTGLPSITLLAICGGLVVRFAVGQPAWCQRSALVYRRPC